MAAEVVKKPDMTLNQIRDAAGLKAYLGKFGLDDVPLANIIYFLQDLDKGPSLGGAVTEYLPRQKQSAPPGAKRIKLYIAEEQQIFREAFQAFFRIHPGIDLIGVSGITSGESLAEAAKTLRPDILLVGVKVLQPGTVEELEALRESCPEVAVVLLSSSYDLKGVKALREFSRGAAVGCAYLLKHTIDTVEQLTQVIASVAEGRIILDQGVMDGMLTGTDTAGIMLKELSPREMDVLGWMAKGYRNDTIAEVLCLELKTVERHINNIYSKIGGPDGSRHPRVSAILSFLRATGQLPSDVMVEA